MCGAAGEHGQEAGCVGEHGGDVEHDGVDAGGGDAAAAGDFEFEDRAGAACALALVLAVDGLLTAAGFEHTRRHHRDQPVIGSCLHRLCAPIENTTVPHASIASAATKTALGRIRSRVAAAVCRFRTSPPSWSFDSRTLPRLSGPDEWARTWTLPPVPGSATY